MKKINKILKMEKEQRLMLILKYTIIINFLVAVTKFVLAISIPSLWFSVNAGFGFVLIISRLWTLKSYRKIRKIKNKQNQLIEEYKIYLKNGAMLILLGIMYFGVSSYMYFYGTNTYMHEYITYLVALMAFYSIGTAIYGIIKYKRNKNPLIKSIKLTYFAIALNHILLTQVTLLDTFEKNYNSRMINGYTGIAVSLIIILVGLYMILGMQKQIKAKL